MASVQPSINTMLGSPISGAGWVHRKTNSQTEICMQEIYLGMLSGSATEGGRQISRVGQREKASADSVRCAESGTALWSCPELGWGSQAFLPLYQPVTGCRLLLAGTVIPGKVAVFCHGNSERHWPLSNVRQYGPKNWEELILQLMKGDLGGITQNPWRWTNTHWKRIHDPQQIIVGLWKSKCTSDTKSLGWS